MKKLLLIASLILATSLSSFAQINSNRTEWGKIVRGPYETNKFWDNIFLNVSGGAFLYTEDFTQQRVTESLTPAYFFSLGKFITPSVGARIKGDFAPDAKEYDFANSADFDKFNKFDYLNVHADFMWNISNAFAGYRHKRTFEFIPYLGLGYASMWHKEDRFKSSAFTCNFGLINKIRVSNTVAFNLELSASLIDDSFNRRSIQNSIDIPLAATFGITINFGGNKPFKRIQKAAPQDNSHYEDRLIEMSIANQELLNRNKELAQKLENANTPVYKVDKVSASPVALFFEIGSAQLSDKELLNLEFYVKNAMKVDKNKKFTITASADRETGSSRRNAELGEARLNYIASLLMGRYGISRGRLVLENDGDLNNRFNKAELNRVVVIE